jgi:SpoVK/Ycf46/Vps4 family AAA+-type ATPase
VLVERLVRPGSEHAVSFLLSGPPGSGESTWIRHLGARMKLQTLQKRAPDLLDPFVGGTAQMIAEAFADARDTTWCSTRLTACCLTGQAQCAVGKSVKLTRR